MKRQDFCFTPLCRGRNPIPWLLFICFLDCHYVNFSLWECRHQNREHYLLPPTCLEPTLIFNFPEFMSPGVHAQSGAFWVPQPTVRSQGDCYKAKLRPFPPLRQRRGQHTSFCSLLCSKSSTPPSSLEELLPKDLHGFHIIIFY